MPLDNLQKIQRNKQQKRNWYFLVAFVALILGIILYRNFSNNIEQNSFSSFQNSFIAIFKILFGTIKNVWFLFLGLFLVAIMLFGVFSVFRRILGFMPIVRNKFLKLFFLKFIYGKSIVKKFILENKKEILKFPSLKDFNDKQIVDLFKDILVSTYKEAVDPQPYNTNLGTLKKLNNNDFRDPNLVNLKFNFIKMGEGCIISFQNEEKDIIKKYINFCKDIIFDNK